MSANERDSQRECNTMRVSASENVSHWVSSARMTVRFRYNENFNQWECWPLSVISENASEIVVQWKFQPVIMSASIESIASHTVSQWVCQSLSVIKYSLQRCRMEQHSIKRRLSSLRPIFYFVRLPFWVWPAGKTFTILYTGLASLSYILQSKTQNCTPVTSSTQCKWF